MIILYRIGVWAWVAIVSIAKLFGHGKAEAAIELRKSKNITSKPGGVIWFHCASTGEFEDVKHLIRLYKEDKSNHVLVTFQSPTGFLSKLPHQEADSVAMLPYDVASRAATFLDQWKPTVVFFARSEFWLGYLFELRKRKIPAYIVGFRVTPQNHYFNFWTAPYYKRCFEHFAHVFCDNTYTQDLLQKHFKLNNVSVVGNPRLDTVRSYAEEKAFEWPFKMMADRPTIVVGSLVKSDVPIVLSTVKQTLDKINWIIAPHEIEAAEIEPLRKELGSEVSLRSNSKPDQDPVSILILDSLGELASVYRIADGAYVGGGFTRKGIHNILEPAVFGLMVSIGPNDRSYGEVEPMKKSGQLTHVLNENDFNFWVNDFLKESKREIGFDFPSDVSKKIYEAI